MTTWRLLVGDARERLMDLHDGSVRCCVTSPPYWGLRDYGTAQWDGGDPECLHRVPATGSTQNKGNNNREGSPFAGDCGLCGARRIDSQIGLESSPEAYVAEMVNVFREVRRVLADDGTLWLNLGDSYNSGGGTVGGGKHSTVKGKIREANFRETLASCKPKDLVGIPWAVAKALRDPYYQGSIKDERDRIWLAAMLDAEGCLFIHKRKAGQNNGQGYQRQNDSYGPGVEIANTSLAVIERVMALVGKGSICSQGPEENNRRKQTIYRWNLRTTECRELVRELYPYLVAKQQQARILIGCPSSGERAEAAHAALMSLHRTGESGVDFKAPESLFRPGYYLRSDIIWNKCNPMPESVTDRPTKAHEHIFLLSKSARYYYDAEAIAESVVRTWDASNGGNLSPVGLHKANGQMRERGGEYPICDGTRNKRSVWTVPTQPYPEAHFATYPEDLIEPCILAGSAVGDTVLDPFTGSGTTGAVAVRHQRHFVGCELNPAYVELARKRIGGVAPLFAQEVA